MMIDLAKTKSAGRYDVTKMDAPRAAVEWWSNFAAILVYLYLSLVVWVFVHNYRTNEEARSTTKPSPVSCGHDPSCMVIG